MWSSGGQRLRNPTEITHVLRDLPTLYGVTLQFSYKTGTDPVT